jgi:hypothetical protein
MRYLFVSFLRKTGGQIDEMVKVNKKVRPADLNSCNIILDFANREVVKCVIEGKILDTSFDKMEEYYKRVYPALISQLKKEAPITANEK